ncbi:hypothetical protein KTO58_20540 [Chitinophaga pendula]|uniref:hypothetical protein n=1 Tax=Chitinophaga TaxID=79328 RepID=UPI000BAE7EF7|nr:MULTISPECIES: hypothetical protein [Chitinophaga]ASZ10969.1 hypothetical protein CK934_08270 [Chitinophaga sp. MD30]UCJ06041.1 hypothetical protein KTO58_20540 [Chitinophaga pendula]
MNCLHVLNGDATLTQFRESGLQGQTVVCREMMCEGKVKYTTDMMAFFETRAKHLEYQYGIDMQTYHASVVTELDKLNTTPDIDEIVLWFEFDLFCQINLLFILHYLKTQKPDFHNISLVSIDHHQDIPDFRGLGMLSAKHFPQLFENRVFLEIPDLELAARAWEAYCQKDPLMLETVSHVANDGALALLGPALKAHLQRLPSKRDGLNTIQRFFLLKLAYGNYRWYDLYYLFWNEMKIYGFGDFQLDIYLQRMLRAGVIEQVDQMVTITALGREILQGEENYLDYVPLQHRWLGGVRLLNSPWRWDELEDKIIQVA